MYRVLILDDEPYIVDWICVLVESIKEYELDVYRSYNTYEALEFLNRAKIDILITDICMPDINGIDLLKTVKKNWKDCKVIMLTGHTDFKYVYESMQNSAYNYILKTEKDIKILSTILEAIKTTENEIKNYQVILETKKKIQDTLILAQEEILLNILKGNQCNQKELTKKFNIHEINFDSKMPYTVLVGNISISGKNTDITDECNCNAIKDIVENRLGCQYIIYGVMYESMKYVWLMQPVKKDEYENGPEMNNARITGILETVQKICHERFNVEISFIYSQPDIDTEKLADVFFILKQIIFRRSLQENGFIIFYNPSLENMYNENIVSNNILKEISRNQRLFERLEIFLASGQKEEFNKELNFVCNELKNAKTFHDSNAIEIYYSVALIMLSYINNKKILNNVAFRIGLNRLMHLDEYSDWSEQTKYLFKLSEVLFDIQEKDYGKNDLIRYVKQFIYQNISDDVTLVKLAEVTGYNPSYISRVFKEITGSTLTEYISTIRLNKVKELVKRRSMSLNQIADKAGFNSRQYFNKFIKKMVNLTPDEFMHSIIENQQ